MMFNYFTRESSEQFIFYRIPKILLTNDFLKKISDSSKLLYGLLLDRVGLSIKIAGLMKMGMYILFIRLQNVWKI